MVLLLPGFAVFLLTASPGGPLQMLRPRVVVLAAAIAALFSLQYAWSFASMLAQPDHPGMADVFRNFWFDVTKSDWRSTMVDGVSWTSAPQRLSQCWFDLRQQFGVPGMVAAIAGFVWLGRKNWRMAAMLAVLWAVNWWFAFTYNVGDVHVFFIPSHWAVALAAGCGAAWVAGRPRPPRPHGRRHVAARPGSGWLALLLAYPAWRIYDTYPAVNRSDDHEPTRFYDRLTAGMDGNREILGTDLNWQLHNGFDYYARYTRPDLVVFSLPETLLYFPMLVSSNAALGRSVALTAGSAEMVRELYGGLYRVERDPRLAVPTLAEQVAGLPKGTPYVLTVMEPDPPESLDRADLAAAAAILGLSPRQVPGGRYALAAGLVGEEPWAGIVPHPAIPRQEVARRDRRGHQDRVVPAVRHHPPRRLRVRHREPAPRPHARPRCVVRRARPRRPGAGARMVRRPLHPPAPLHRQAGTMRME